MASTYLTRTPSSTTNRKTFTVSFWIKSSGAGGSIFSTGDYGAGDGFFNVKLSSSGRLTLDDYDQSGNSYNVRWVTPGTTVFRDPAAWYHMVISVDSTQATLSDRVNFYLNGENIDSLFTDNASGTPSLNADFHINYNKVHQIGRSPDNTDYFDGSMSHFHLIDGTAYDASAFGETDATTGIWKPKTAPSVTYGTNGFFLKFENSGAFGTDSSGNANTFTVNGTMTQNIDTPSNVFATMNPLASQSGSSSSSSAFTFSNGNLSVSNLTSETGIANLGVSQGKWFWEVKVITDQAGLAIGACNDGQNLDDELGYQSGSSQSYAKAFGYYGDNGNKFTTMGDGSQMSAYGDAISVNDIIGVAMNLDDNEVTFYKNGTAQNSGTAISITALADGEVYFPAVGNYSGATIAVDFNFGNGYFGTTAVSSAQNPDDGIGIFEYAVPTGYKSLCTKSINAQEYD